MKQDENEEKEEEGRNLATNFNIFRLIHKLIHILYIRQTTVRTLNGVNFN